MLRLESLDAVAVLAKKTSDAGLSIVPLPNSPLALALQHCYTPVLDETHNLDLYVVMQRLHEASTQKDLGGNFPHDDAMQVLVAMVSDTVQRNLQLARTIVNPQVKQLAERVDAEINKAEIKTSSPIAIIPDYLNGVWASPTLEALVERYEESYAENMPAPQWFPEITGDQALELVKSGSGAFDAEVAAWAEKVGVEFLMDVYCQVFATNKPGYPALNSIYDFIDNKSQPLPSTNRDRALAVFLMARNLKKDAPEGANMTLNEFREKMLALIEQAGRVVAVSLQRRRADIKRGMLVPFWPAIDVKSALVTGANIVVIGEVYDQWIAGGGAPELILGAYVTDQNAAPQHLLDNAERYRAAWNRNLMMLKSQSNAGRYNATIKALSEGVKDIINELNENDIVVTNKGVLFERLNDVLSTIVAVDAEDVFGTARKVLCYVLYAHTDAEKLLKILDHMLEEFEGLDVREAALYAVIDLMAEWLLKLVDVRIGAIPNGPTSANEKAACALATLGTAVELGVEVIDNIAGNDISNQMAGQPATPSLLATTLALKIQNKLQHLLP